MKRILIALCFCATVISVMLNFVPQPFCKVAERFPKDATATVFCRKTSCPSTNVGNGFLVECTVQNLLPTLSQCEQVDGVSVKFNCSKLCFHQVVNQFNLQNESRLVLNGVQVVCGYSAKVQGCVVIDGQKINVQIACDGQTVTVGSPLILDSF